MATGQVLFQRFFYTKSFVKHSMEVGVPPVPRRDVGGTEAAPPCGVGGGGPPRPDPAPGSASPFGGWRPGCGPGANARVSQCFRRSMCQWPVCTWPPK